MRALLLLVVLSGCAKDLSELEPYPCAASLPYCPAGRACIDGVCQPAIVDQPCSDFVDCALGDAAAVCVGGACEYDIGALEWVCNPGICALPCVDGTCPAEHTCDTTLNVCLHNCAGTCPGDNKCRTLGTARVCRP